MRHKRKRLRPGQVTIARASFESIANTVVRADQRFFNQHPSIKRYIRPYVPGEFGDIEIPDGTTHVAVLRGDGQQGRIPLTREEAEKELR